MSQRILLSLLVFFSVWTFGANAIGLAALQSWLLYPALAVSLAAGLAALAWGGRWAREGFPVLAAEAPATGGGGGSGSGGLTPRARLFACGLAGGALLLGMAVQYKWTRLEPFWLLCALTIAAGIVLGRGAPGPALSARPAAADTALPVLAVFAVFGALYLWLNVPDSDDSLYVAFAISARDAAHVYAADSFFGLPDFPFAKSTYRLESYILLTAALSGLTGLPALNVEHLVTPVFGLLFAAAALTVVARSVAGIRWQVWLAAYIILMLAFSGTYSAFGFHGLPRIFHGKGVLVLAAVPLIIHLSAAAILSGSWRVYALLGLAQAAALGLTANAIYIGPLASAIVGLAFLLLGGARLRLRALALAGTILYPAAMGAWLVAFDPPSMSQIQDVGKVGGMFWTVGGSPAGHVLMTAALALGALAALARPGLRLVSLYTLAVLLTVLNPLLWPFWGAHVTGNVNDRLFYAAPLLLFIALGFAWAQARLPLLAWAPAALALAATLAAPFSMLRNAGPGESLLRVPAQDIADARLLNGLGRGALLAPEPASGWIPTLEGARPVVVARRIDFVQREGQFAPEAYAARIRLADWVSGAAPDPGYEGSGALAADLDAICVASVALTPEMAAAPQRAPAAFEGFAPRQEGCWLVLSRDAPC